MATETHAGPCDQEVATFQTYDLPPALRKSALASRYDHQRRIPAAAFIATF